MLRRHFTRIFWHLIIGFACVGTFLAEPAPAANYDGDIHFQLKCRRMNGGWWSGDYAATVLNGKFSGRMDFKRGEDGCHNKRCWTSWEGTIQEDGKFKFNVRENAWDQVSNYVSHWALIGKFSTEDSGTSKVIKFPKDWQLKYQDSTVELIDPAPNGLAGRGASQSEIAANGEAEAPPPTEQSNEILSAKNEAVQEMGKANAALVRIEKGGLRTVIERSIQSLSTALERDSVASIKSQAEVLSQLVTEAERTMSSEGTIQAKAESIVSPVKPESPAAIVPPQKRVALVIGNSSYQNATELPNPRNDAAAISAKLTELGFDVVEGQDLDKTGMEKSVRLFISKVEGADVSLFFYAGHGMQVAGKNYLIPIDARLEDAAAVDFETIDADRILGYMSDENRVAIAFLDACRDNPLARRFARSLGATRSAAIGRGLAVPSGLGGGMLIGFATAPGEVALDGDGKNSPFTTALLKYLPEQHLEIQQMMTKVKSEVYEATNKQQSPWHNSDLRKEFYLKP
jgi:caspase domain-containing protein